MSRSKLEEDEVGLKRTSLRLNPAEMQALEEFCNAHHLKKMEAIRKWIQQANFPVVTKADDREALQELAMALASSEDEVLSGLIQKAREHLKDKIAEAKKTKKKMLGG